MGSGFLVQVFLVFEVVARQGKTAGLAKVLLLNEQHVELLAVKAKNHTVN